MLTTPLLSLALCCQGAVSGDTWLLPTPSIGSLVVVRKSYAGVDLHSLNELAYLTFEDTGPIATRQASVRALVAKGRAVELTADSNARVDAVVNDNIYLDSSTNRPIPVYRVVLTDSQSPGRSAYVLAGQLVGDTPERGPIRLDEKNLAIYREVRSAIIAARNRKAGAEVSRRKMLMDRAGDEAKRLNAKKNGLDLAVLEEIIRLGEEADGTAARKALVNSPAKQEARARNDAMLQVMDKQIALGVNQALKQSALDDRRANQLFAGQGTRVHGFHPLAIIYGGGLGYPMDQRSSSFGGAGVVPLRGK